MIDEFIKAKGELLITLTGPDNEVKTQIKVPNAVVKTGRALMVLRLYDGSGSAVTLMDVGTSGTAVADSNTALGGGLAANQSVSVTGWNGTDPTITYNATFGAGVGTGSLQEAGLFASSTMVARTTFATITKGAGDTLTIAWTISLT